MSHQSRATVAVSWRARAYGSPIQGVALIGFVARLIFVLTAAIKLLREPAMSPSN